MSLHWPWFGVVAKGRGAPGSGSLCFLFTSQQGDERDQPVLLHHLVQFVLQVIICVGLQAVLYQDPAAHQQVMKPVRDVKHNATCRRDAGNIYKIIQKLFTFTKFWETLGSPHCFIFLKVIFCLKLLMKVTNTLMAQLNF